MAKYKITQDRDGCISCGACASACPDNWEMADDGKSKPKKTDISEEEFECNNKAAAGCPVNIIHIKNTETGEDII
ncbi:MAG: ferredoxin [Nanoarchaeota archaeon]|nr:ferredoxin [Nanoarchaeota archaeon]MCG2717304.1 ferredoxin [Nanoarchaeota archaeon]